MNIEEVMANLLNWARFEPYMRPNDLGEGVIDLSFLMKLGMVSVF